MMYLSASLYDVVYTDKDYQKEADRLDTLIKEHKPDAAQLLDVACGTGQHLFFLQKHYGVEGLDINPEFVSIAQRKLPQAVIHTQDMTNFKLPTKFDVVTCLFSSIGYTLTKTVLFATVLNMRNHLKPGGLLIIEPWYTPTTFKPGHYTATIQDFDSGKVARTNFWAQKNDFSVGDSQFLVVDSTGIKHISEKHELGLFSQAEYASAFTQAGLKVSLDDDGLTGRGLFIGVAPSA